MPLTDAQVDRYSRQIILAEVGGTGQEKLLRACVQVGGAGAVAAWATRYLVAAGIGEVLLEPPLSESLRDSLAELNPDCRVGPAPARFEERRRQALIAGAGDPAIADAWDNGVAVVVTRAVGDSGDLALLVASDPSSPCPACAGFAATAEDAGEAFPGSAAPLVATLAVTEVLKLVLGVGRGLCGRRLLYDAGRQTVQESRLCCRPDCPRRAT